MDFNPGEKIRGFLWMWATMLLQTCKWWYLNWVGGTASIPENQFMNRESGV
jgi:hypothetical protein